MNLDSIGGPSHDSSWVRGARLHTRLGMSLPKCTIYCRQHYYVYDIWLLPGTPENMRPT